MYSLGTKAIADDRDLHNRNVRAGGDSAAEHAIPHERNLHQRAAEELVESAGDAHLPLEGGVDEEFVVENVGLKLSQRSRCNLVEQWIWHRSFSCSDYD
jgi:hypothetical protein